MNGRAWKTGFFPCRGKLMTRQEIADASGYLPGYVKDLQNKKGLSADEIVDRAKKRKKNERRLIDPYTDEDLFDLFTYYAGRVSAEEEAERLTDFMGKSRVDKEVVCLLAEFRVRLYRRCHA